MENQKQKIVNGAKQYADYITTHINQRDENGNVKYYFSGSLAMLLLSSASSIKSCYLNQEGKPIIESSECALTNKNKQGLSYGIRSIGLDVDVISVDDSVFKDAGNIYNLRAVREHCDLATDLCPKWMRINGTMYFDYLADERTFEGYDISELTMQTGEKIIIADPLCMVIHKLADSIKCKSSIENLRNKGKLRPETEKELTEKYERNINDFVSMFNGTISLYPNIDFKKVIEHVLNSCPETAFSGIMKQDSASKIKQFGSDARDKINKEYQNLFDNFIKTIVQQNNMIIKNTPNSCPVQ